MNKFYFYHAVVTRIYDGDTVTLDIDLGFNTWLKNQNIRLSGINAPEIRGEERENGLASRDALRRLVLGKKIILESIKDSTDKYGRWLGVLHYDPTPEQLNEVSGTIRFMNVNEWLVRSGYAEFKEY
jgi:micrococcal nuclease